MFWSGKKENELKEPLDNLVSLASDHLPQDKWEFLYAYSRKSLDEEIARFQAIDDKSVKLLSAVSIMITIFLALVKWVFEDSSIAYTHYVYVLVAFVFISLSAAWYFFFSALKLRLTPRMPLNDSILALFKDNKLATIYLALYKSCQKAVVESRENVEQKADKLSLGYNATAFAAVFLTLTIIMVSFESTISSKTEVTKTMESISMPGSNEQQTPSPSSCEPDWDVTAPDIDYVKSSVDRPAPSDNEAGHIMLDSED